jgi:hypothetical protein
MMAKEADGAEGELPPTEWLNNILKRDFSEFDPVDDDSETEKEEKKENKQAALEFFDFYMDKMLPTCAGTKMWHTGVRHFTALSDNVLPNSPKQELRVSYATEALCALLYENGRDKWIAMHQWIKNKPANQKLKVPRWRKDAPEENKEFRAKYSDPYAGQNKYGGWPSEGRLQFVEYGKMVKTARTEDLEHCIAVEKECAKRLFAQNSEHYAQLEEKKKNKRKSLVLDVDDDDMYDWGF